MRISAALLLLGFAAGCADRPTLLLEIARGALDPSDHSSRLQVTLLDANVGTELATATVSSDQLGEQSRLFDGLDLVPGRRYRLTLMATGIDPVTSGCPAGRAVGMSPEFRYREAITRLGIYFDCADSTSLTSSTMREERVFHTATWVANPPPHGRVVFIGGASASIDLDDVRRTELRSTIEIFDPLDGEFELHAASLSPPRAWHQAVSVGDGAIVISGGFGIDDSGEQARFTLLRRVDRFADDVLTGLPSLVEGRAGHGAALLEGGQLLLAKGFSEVQIFARSVELYSVEQQQSVQLLPNAQGIAQVAPPVVGSGAQALIVGGNWSRGERLPNERFCLGQDCQCEGPCVEQVPGFPVNEGRLNLTATYVPCSTDPEKGAIYMVGGNHEQLVGADVFFDDIYCVQTANLGGEPRRAGRLRQARAAHTTTAVRGAGGQTRLLVAGGLGAGGDDGVPLLDAELVKVDCSCGSISTEDIRSLPLKKIHVLHSATALPDGTVLLAGGIVSGNAERFNPDF